MYENLHDRMCLFHLLGRMYSGSFFQRCQYGSVTHIMHHGFFHKIKFAWIYFHTHVHVLLTGSNLSAQGPISSSWSRLSTKSSQYFGQICYTFLCFHPCSLLKSAGSRILRKSRVQEIHQAINHETRIQKGNAAIPLRPGYQRASFKRDRNYEAQQYYWFLFGLVRSFGCFDVFLQKSQSIHQKKKRNSDCKQKSEGLA